MAHLQGRNMYLLLSDVDVVFLSEYIDRYIYIYIYIDIYTICFVLLPYTTEMTHLKNIMVLREPLYCIELRRLLKPTQPPVQWVPGLFRG
jgi:hypothetical protein